MKHKKRFRYFRILKIRILGRYGLLKSIHRRIIIDFICGSIKYFQSEHPKLESTEFASEMNKAQLKYFQSIKDEFQ